MLINIIQRDARFLSADAMPRLLAWLLVEPAVHAVGHIRWSFRGRLKVRNCSLLFGVAGICLH
jgi:hypothetical protein